MNSKSTLFNFSTHVPFQIVLNCSVQVIQKKTKWVTLRVTLLVTWPSASISQSKSFLKTGSCPLQSTEKVWILLGLHSMLLLTVQSIPDGYNHDFFFFSPLKILFNAEIHCMVEANWFGMPLHYKVHVFFLIVGWSKSTPISTFNTQVH